MSSRFPIAVVVLGVAVLGFIATGQVTEAQVTCTSTASPQAPQNLRIAALFGRLFAVLSAQSTGSCWPDASNTGYKRAPDYPGSLTTYSSTAIAGVACSGPITSGKTYRFCDFPGGLFVGSTSNAVSNVTFYGCRFHSVAVDGVLVALFGDNLTFDYSTFEPNGTFVAGQQIAHNSSYQYGIAADGSYGAHVGQLTVSHSDFWGFGNAIDTAGSTQAKPQVFRDNWIHDAANDGNGDYHTDGIGTLSGSGNGSYVVLDHNTISSPGNTNGVAFQQGTYSHFTITNNLFSGFGYTVALWATGSGGHTFTGNTFSTALKPVFGPLYPQSFWSTSGSVWKCNKWLVPAGSSGNAADNGKYWTPNGVSATDYLGNTSCP
jgi:hypothetical protein